MCRWYTGAPVPRSAFDVSIPALAPILLIVFVDVLGLTVVIPLLPFYAQGFGATPAIVGLLISTYAIGALFAGPALGRASDRWGRKPVLIVSQLGSLGGFVLLACAPSLTWLFVARALDGITAGNLIAARAYLSDVTPPAQRSAAFGLIAAAFGLGYLVGPAGSALLATWSHTAPLWAAAALATLTLLCTVFLLPARPVAASIPTPMPLREVLALPGLWPRLLQWLAFALAFSLFTSGFALFCERRLHHGGQPFGPTQVGWLLTYLGALGLVAQLALLRPLVARFGEAHLVSASLLMGGVGHLILAVSHSLFPLLLALALSGLGSSLLRPALLGLMSQAVPPTRQGVVFGVTQSLQSLAMIAAPLAAGLLIEWGRLSTWALSASTALLVAALLGLRNSGAPYAPR